ncbi:hypothetical protein McpCs1_14190 [Methanocorpusculaceae archaeon Cs1]|uniref:Type II toxin-antitoxin system HicA family toxin n=2 Tax=Methanorbis rubei TaxID=3028300 RepID=A0AAE4MH46_9EURY|nr:hypothetical protein [Methanocorpusculaceae archaeon Cs1]
MVVLKADVVKKVLQKKGFAPVSGKQKHPRFTFFDEGIRSTVTTHMSHNNQEINDFLQSQMAEQTYLSKAEFLEMISCTIGHDELVARYVTLGLLQKD